MCKDGGGIMVLIGSIMVSGVSAQIHAILAHMIRSVRLHPSHKSEMSYKGALPYQSSKAAVATMGKCMANELAAFGVRVNVVQPGYIDTPGERRFSTEEEIQRWAEKVDIPARRIGTPRDIGTAVAFLCSDAASYITGAVLSVDGGFLTAMGLLPRSTPRSAGGCGE